MADNLDLQTKIERAIYALLTQMGVSSPLNTFPGEASDPTADRPIPNTTILAGEGFEEDFQPGNFRFPGGKIIFRDEGIVQPGGNNPLAAFVAANQRSGAVLGQLILSDDTSTMDYTRRQLNDFGRAMAEDASNGANPLEALSAQNNADMVDFTLLYWRVIDYGKPEKQTSGDVVYYERIAMFECVACNSNID